MSAAEAHGSPDVQAASRVIERIATQVGPSVVGLGRGWGVGSGVVFAPDRVLTVAHAVRGEETTVTFEGRRTAAAEVAGVDADRDLAVLAVETEDAEPVAWEPAGSGVPIGAPVVALGNPGGRGLRATLGYASSGARSVRGPRGRRVEGAIEHTAPLPRGSSGGPLVDLSGRLLGLNAVRLDGGLILALPADAVTKTRVDGMARGQRPRTRRLGLAVAPPRAARRMRRAVGLPERPGVLVRAVEEGSPADVAGVARGDLVVAAGGDTVDGIDALHRALDAVDEGGELKLSLVRGTDERDVTVSFEDRGTGAAAG